MTRVSELFHAWGDNGVSNTRKFPFLSTLSWTKTVKNEFFSLPTTILTSIFHTFTTGNILAIQDSLFR